MHIIETASNLFYKREREKKERNRQLYRKNIHRELRGTLPPAE
jgi:hypothetical protein